MRRLFTHTFTLARSLFHTGHLLANKALVAFVALGFVLALVPALVPEVRNVLGVVPLGAGQWVLVFGIGLGLLMLVEAGKWAALHRTERREQRIRRRSW